MDLKPHSNQDPATPKETPKTKGSFGTSLICVGLAGATVLVWAIFSFKSYYLEATILVILALIPAFANLESRRPKAREVVLLAILCALLVVTRVLFIALPFFKPTVGLVIIVALAFGSRYGYLLGACAMLFSDFIFGLGPWTPWQMLAFGLAGLVFGVLGERGTVQKTALSPKGIFGLSVGGFLFVLIILGPLLDTCALFILTSNLRPETVASIYIAGIGPNALLAVATAMVLALATNPLLQMFARVRRKYDL